VLFNNDGTDLLVVIINDSLNIVVAKFDAVDTWRVYESAPVAAFHASVIGIAWLLAAFAGVESVGALGGGGGLAAATLKEIAVDDVLAFPDPSMHRT